LSEGKRRGSGVTKKEAKRTVQNIDALAPGSVRDEEKKKSVRHSMARGQIT